ncbi:MAG TPA: pyridoxamine 5'-phosphate oxidase family protein [Thermomicrobiales bacterium]|jgi:hypothetical protein|nr:pyridoxamine 5'-phosphate oxidase family protein [Thermomicrobiales bacterium]
MGVIRVLPDDRIEHLLRTALVGRIACASPEVDNGRPFLVPLAYGYDGDAVYAHSGPGRKLLTMRQNPLASFEVDTAEAEDRWSSVICEVTYEELSDPDARAAGLRVIYPEPKTIPELGEQTVVYRLVITARSGRYELPE